MKKSIIAIILYALVCFVVSKSGFLESSKSKLFGDLMLLLFIYYSIINVLSFTKLKTKNIGTSLVNLFFFISFYDDYNSYFLLKSVYYFSILIFVAVNIYVFVVKRKINELK